ncbi:ATP-binding protein, partial [Clostridium saudiense]|nr:ATP-binding protein [Clostridium saudiense]
MDEKKLLSIISKGEGIKVDFKRELCLNYESCKKELAKDVCAIANSRGGRGYIIVGVEDKSREIVGVRDLNSLNEEKIQQIISSRCEPPIPIMVEIVEIQNK